MRSHAATEVRAAICGGRRAFAACYSDGADPA